MDIDKLAEKWTKKNYKEIIEQTPFMLDFIKPIFIKGFLEGRKGV